MARANRKLVHHGINRRKKAFLKEVLESRLPRLCHRIQEGFALPIERYNDKEAGVRLRNIVTPFVLRRLKTGSSIPDRSGKLNRITEMLEEVLAEGDSGLIFTQFAEMGSILKTHFQKVFGQEVLFLYGGVNQKQRDRMVMRFSEKNGPKIVILSLKAGGVGLNLTRANPCTILCQYIPSRCARCGHKAPGYAAVPGQQGKFY